MNTQWSKSLRGVLAALVVLTQTAQPVKSQQPSPQLGSLTYGMSSVDVNPGEVLVAADGSTYFAVGGYDLFGNLLPNGFMIPAGGTIIAAPSNAAMSTQTNDQDGGITVTVTNGSGGTIITTWYFNGDVEIYSATTVWGPGGVTITMSDIMWGPNGNIIDQWTITFTMPVSKPLNPLRTPVL